MGREKCARQCITPGFFPAEQNRRLLFTEDGSPTPRAAAIHRRTSVPVTKLLAGNGEKDAAPTVFGFPKRHRSVAKNGGGARRGEPSSCEQQPAILLAGKKPGVMALTRTFFAAHSRARNWVRLITAALAAEYATTRDRGGPAETLPMLRMLPPPRLTMPGPNSWQQQHAADEVEIKIRLPVGHGDLIERVIGGDGDFGVVYHRRR